MVHRVLVAVDGSEASNTALEIACGLADKYEAALGLLTVIEPEEVEDELIAAAKTEGVIQGNSNFTNVYDGTYAAYTATPVVNEIERSTKAIRLATILAESTVEKARAYSSEQPFQAVKTFVSSGDPAKAILACAKENDADIIIMGHDEPKWYKAPFKKSVAKTVQRGANCPVLVYSSPEHA